MSGTQADFWGPSGPKCAKNGRVAQRESTRFTSEWSQVRSLPRPPSKSDDGWVYFILCGSLGLVKIGWSSNPDNRLCTLRDCFPYPLTIITARKGGRDVEKGLHARFADLAELGEWFRFEGRLRAYVKRIVVINGRRPWPEAEPVTIEEARAEWEEREARNAILNGSKRPVPFSMSQVWRNKK